MILIRKTYRFRAIALGLAVSALSGCSSMERLAEVGEAPKLTQVVSPTAKPDYKPVSLPMPAPTPMERHPNSLWRPGARAFFKDQRANDVGDILTVMIEIKDEAEINNTTKRARKNNEDASANAFLGYESSLSRVLPETINLKIAALVSQILPNGNLVIHGRQEVRVNFEVRELLIAGVIRPEDIGSDNTISYEKIAEARISYGGRGQITDFQQPRYGQQFFDVLMPF